MSTLFPTSQNDFANSFVVENNPWHPGAGEARFAYYLSEESGLEFRIFTITGEEVLSRIISEGSASTTIGSHIITWDGKNGAGDKVLDGIYVVSLRNVTTGTTARLKLAVLK